MGLFGKKKGKLISSSVVFDSANRATDENGRLIVNKSLITKATVSQYYGQEIPNFEKLGLDPMKKYNVYRPLEELKKSIKKFDMLPLLDKHIMDYANMPQKESWAGSLGNPVIEGNGVYGSLSVWTSEAIQDIESEEKRELSLGYNADYRLENGEFEGVPYEIIMENIRPNHLALVKKARVRGAAVFDEHPEMKMIFDGFNKYKGSSKIKGEESMKKFIDSLKKAIGIYDENPEAFKEVEGEEVKDSDRLAKMREVLVAKYGEEQATEILEALATVSDNSESDVTEDEGGEVKPKEPTHQSSAGGAEKKETPEVKKPTMDAAAIEKKAREAAKAEMLGIERAKEATREVLGNVAVQDSAEAYYKLGCQALGLETKGIADSRFQDMYLGAVAMQKKNGGAEKGGVTMDAAAQAAMGKDIDGIFDKAPKRS